VKIIVFLSIAWLVGVLVVFAVIYDDDDIVSSIIVSLLWPFLLVGLFAMLLYGVIETTFRAIFSRRKSP